MEVAVQQEPSTSGDGDKERETQSSQQKKSKKHQPWINKRKTSNANKHNKRNRQKGGPNQSTEMVSVTQTKGRGKHTGHKNSRAKNRQVGYNSKFFLPGKLPRKERLILPTKFLLGGNISDPLNLNSLQNESENACTPKSSPGPTQPRVEVLNPPNINDPLHLLDPVDSVEYEMQLCSPVKPRKPPKHRNRKRRKSSKENVEGDTSTEAESGVDVNIESASTQNLEHQATPVGGAKRENEDAEKIVKNLKLELGEPSTGRKRHCSESSTHKAKSRRVDLDKIVSPVIPQHTGWKRNHKPSRPPLRRTRSHTQSLSEKPKTEEGEEAESHEHVEEEEEEEKEVEAPPPKKGVKFRYGNYDRHKGYHRLDEIMDVRIQVFLKHPQLFKHKDVLDIGCNKGLLTIAVAQMLQPKSIVGVDIDRNLINGARNNLSMYVRVPEDTPQPSTSKAEPRKRKRRYSRRYSRQPKQQLQQQQQQQLQSQQMQQTHNMWEAKPEFFPLSMPMCLGPMPTLGDQPPQAIDPQDDGEGCITFPDNVFFRTVNYVPKDEAALQNETQQYDLILCLSVSKWVHLNFGDAGLKLAFKKMFNQLRPGGKLILEAQNWPSYRKTKKISDIVAENYRSIKFFPRKFNEYLLSTEVGFSHSYPLGIPKHLNKGFSRPIQLYVKGDFTPNHAQWSDYHLSQTPYQTPRSDPHKTKYYTNMLLGNQTPFASHGSYSYRNADPSPYYNPAATDSYLPSYDNVTTRRTYFWASPLYSTTWSPPANDGSRSGSLQNTPRRVADVEDPNWPPHVYPPSGDAFSPDAGTHSSRSAENDYATSPNSPVNHVYAVEPVVDDKDDSRSPRLNHMEQYPEHLNEAALPEQNGILNDEEEGGSSSPSCA